MCIFESFSLRLLDGIIHPNMRPMISLVTAGFCCFLMTFSPQKVKNMVTLCPVAAAPLARTKEASARSRSSLNTISVLFFGLMAAGAVAFASAFSAMAVTTPFSLVSDTRRLPVLLHQLCTSRAKPGSVEVISTISPAWASSNDFFSFMIGPGH